MTALRLIAASTLALALAACSGGDSGDAAPDADAADDTVPVEDVAMTPDTADAAETDSDEAPAGLPATEIHLAGLSWVDGVPSIGTPRNVTNHPGYDNQPAFVPGQHHFHYSAEAEDGTTDIFLHTGEGNAPVRLTDTPGVGEYSPRLSRDGRAVVVLRQDEAGAQIVTRIEQMEGDLTPVLDLDPVGYFAFNAEGSQIAMFVLTEPFTLQVADLATGDVRIVHEDIGTALHATPDGSGAVFTTPRGDGGFQARRYDFASGETEILFDLPGQSANYALVAVEGGPAGVFSADDGMLVWRSADGTDWTPVADLAGFGLTGVTRMAVSDDATRIAIVAAEDPPSPR